MQARRKHGRFLQKDTPTRFYWESLACPFFFSSSPKEKKWCAAKSPTHISHPSQSHSSKQWRIEQSLQALVLVVTQFAKKKKENRWQKWHHPAILLWRAAPSFARPRHPQSSDTSSHQYHQAVHNCELQCCYLPSYSFMHQCQYTPSHLISLEEALEAQKFTTMSCFSLHIIPSQEHPPSQMHHHSKLPHLPLMLPPQIYLNWKWSNWKIDYENWICHWVGIRVSWWRDWVSIIDWCRWMIMMAKMK